MNGISYRKLVKLLAKNKTRIYVDSSRAKGSHRLLVRDGVDGSKCSYPLPFHGMKTLIPPKMLVRIIQRFDLPPDIFD